MDSENGKNTIRIDTHVQMMIPGNIVTVFIDGLRVKMR